MKNIFLTPGPTEIHPIAKQAIHHALETDICAISHRSKEFEQIYLHAENQLRSMMQIPKAHQIFFLSSATECWERIIQGGVEKNSHHLVNGAFSKRFYETATELGKQPTLCEKPIGQGFELSDIPKNLQTEMICFTQNETSTGVCLRDGLIEEVSAQFKDSLIALDAVSCAPYSKVDLQSVDYYFFSVQKFFCLPAGLAVLVVSPKAMQKAQTLKKHLSIGAHHSLTSLSAYAQKHQTPCTPNVLAIYTLGIMAGHLNDIGIEQLRLQTHQKAKLLYDCLDHHKEIKAYVQNKSWRSDTVITIDTGKNAQRVIQKLAEQNLIVGQGYGPLKDNQFRIANFPVHTQQVFEKLCGILEKGMD